MEDEVVRIAKKMDKMVQKKNAVSGGRAGGPRAGRDGDTGPRGAGRAAPRRAPPPACTSVLATSAGSPGRDPPRLRDVRPRRLPPNGCLGAAIRLRAVECVLCRGPASVLETVNPPSPGRQAWWDTPASRG